MQALSPAIEVYPVHHLPILKAYADQLGLVLMGEILRADETRLALLADLVQQTGLLHLSEEPTTPRGRRRKGTVHPFRRPAAARP
jgi:hypothetical protein